MGLKQPVWGIFTKVAFGPAPYDFIKTYLVFFIFLFTKACLLVLLTLTCLVG